MFIVWLEPPNAAMQGDHIYRTLQPCRALGEHHGVEVASGTLLSPEMHRWMYDADILVIALAVDADLLPVLAERKRLGRPTVFEINDDFTAVQPWNPTGAFFAAQENRALAYQLANAADAVQVTTPEIARRFGALNATCRVFPNQLWEEPADVPKAGRFRIGWAGSLGHRDDILWAAPVLREVLVQRPHVELGIMAPDELLQALARELEDVTSRVVWKSHASLEEYKQFIGQLHVGLAPLLPTDFNACRSDVKWLEYASHQVAPVCSRLAPYSTSVEDGQTGLFFQTRDELQAKLLYLIDAPSRALALGQAASEAAAARRERQHAQQRLAFFARLEPPDDGEPHWQCPPTYPQSSYRRMRFGPLETRLYDALRAGASGAHARAALAEAAKLAPQFYLPHMYWGAAVSADGEGVQHLERAAALAPGSPRVQSLLARRHVALGDLARARACLRRACELAPSWAGPHEQLGVLAMQAGDAAAALAHWRRAVAVNPFATTPRHRAAAHLATSGDADAAVELLRTNLAVDAKSWQDRLLLAQLLQQHAAHADAAQVLEPALSLAPANVQVLATLAKSVLALGQRRRARELVRQAERARGRSRSAR